MQSESTVPSGMNHPAPSHDKTRRQSEGDRLVTDRAEVIHSLGESLRRMSGALAPARSDRWYDAIEGTRPIGSLKLEVGTATKRRRFTAQITPIQKEKASMSTSLGK